jgi:threonine/homoserine/homoserine lactone efflux protein
VLSVFVTSLLIGFSGAVAPGPMSASVIGAGTRRPIAFASALVFGHGVPELFMVAAIACGVHSIPYLEYVALAGSVVLFLFGVQQYRSASDATMDSQDERLPFVYGIVATLSNPYWWLWWLTFGVGYLAMNPSFSEFYLGHISADLIWFVVLAAVVAKGAGFLGTYYKIVVKASGIAMMLFALIFAFSIFSV